MHLESPQQPQPSGQVRQPSADKQGAASPAPQTERNGPSGKGAQKGENSPEQIDYTPFGQFALAVVGLWISWLIYGVYQRQAGIMGKQADISRRQEENAYVQLRPYMFVTAAEIIAATPGGMVVSGPTGAPLMIGVGMRPTSRLQIQNTGQTPAYEAQVYGGLAWLPWPLKDADFRPLNFDDPNITKATIGPQNFTFKWDIIGALDQEMFDSLSAFPATTAGAIVAYGEVRYRDGFGRRWVTKYRYFTGGPTGLRGTSMAAHQEGNDAT